METHFHMKGFALSLTLKQRLNATRQWPIDKCLGGGGVGGICYVLETNVTRGGGVGQAVT